MFRRSLGLTLIELIVAISLIAVIVIGFSSIDIFSRYHVLTADRRAKLQNEVSYALDHMSKVFLNLVQCTGVCANGTCAHGVIDYNLNGQVDSIPPDRYIRYYYYAGNYTLIYCPQHNPSGGNCLSTIEVLSQKISNCIFTYNSTNNYVDVNITACWNPANPGSCGTPDNPSISMQTRLLMPSISTH